MSWIQLEALPLLIVAPLAGLLLWALDRRRTQRLARIAGPRVSTLATGAGTGRRRTLLFSAALLLAMVSPAFAWHWEGCVYCDVNGNGILDDEDIPLPGVFFEITNN